jgi:hypothetical protein
MSSLAATASVAEDHRRCGPECSLVGLLPWQMDFVKPSFRIYDGCTDTAKRVSTAVPLKDGAVLQVYPEKRHFATLDDWRRCYPVAWETRRTLTHAERTTDVGHGPVLYNGKKEGVMAPLALEEECVDLTDEPAVEAEAAASAAEEALGAFHLAAERMGYVLFPKAQWIAMRDLIRSMA